MTLESQRLLDLYAGTLLRILLKPAAWLLSGVLQRRHDLGNCRSLTFLKLHGGGSLAIAYPALLGLRRTAQVRELRIVTTPAVEPFARVLGVFDEILVIRDRGWLELAASAARAIGRLFRCDSVIDLEIHSRLGTVFSLLTCARNRIGSYTSDSSRHTSLSTHVLFCNPSGKVYEFYDQVAHLFGAVVPGMAECTRILRHSLGLPEARGATECAAVGLAPTCSALRKERMLRPAEWVEIVKRKIDERGPAAVEFHLLGGEFERARLDELAGMLRAVIPGVRVKNQAGGRPLAERLREVAQLREVVCVDSAMLHFARLLGTPVTSYWGPSDPETLLRPAAGSTDEIHYEKISCSPCVYATRVAPCRGNNVCMRLACNPQAQVDRNPTWTRGA